MTDHISINSNLVEMEYAVRGKIPIRAEEMEKEGKPIISCNIGNPQAFGQKPITFYRQVLSLLEFPSAINRERDFIHNIISEKESLSLYSNSILEYAESILMELRSGTGAYSESKGPLFIRKAIANFIDNRDKSENSKSQLSNFDHIFLTDGASDGAKRVLEILISDKNDGIMIPIPQYPLYSATIRRCGGTQVNYYPDEESDWSLNKSILEDSFAAAVKQGIKVKAIVVINPGNPTGSILDQESIAVLLDFAEEHDLAIIADEVYQDNIYGETFTSFASEKGERDILLFSLHSSSKGFHGECGHRGGYLEVRGNPVVNDYGINLIDILLKQASVSLCSNTIGQCLIYMMVNPIEKDTEDFIHYESEKTNILTELKEKATIIKEAIQEMNGMEIFGRTGAMYLFPRINKMPADRNDFDYCMALLEETGLCTVNGAGFGQKNGTHHLRIAFLPPKNRLEIVLPQWIQFHNQFVSQS
ncbi:MAG: aminotransferase class I/II-fold pyridoxal phosphate-dependent enzyme [Candidatus Marinimicrobia bacterium]|jgi:aspartate/methionine/tyrosine aminotransferase|nr:aminotransferase class I/II-fold pyridoxal phosphate-dependent enzyme [Candidatus Neomarinimicrobiota bacterium]MBT3618187.1 aminotransferase class I/II-fold pyridoxal phosphate-dependent enzyme [Candidatus Neomarinimicrobiota bacterium]MBT3828658.1 aminotransferase class I/II-fold pyridoxal phosphate-dependent enzyme [Candidatus Neomarinimicrobiota bacterium]MBT3996880.1 aminotransferase class I/II-fold pyridoxal phosphate-dependent enzyme [Candidatus Neomarinimicrobiota bacterium]MBT428084